MNISIEFSGVAPSTVTFQLSNPQPTRSWYVTSFASDFGYAPHNQPEETDTVTIPIGECLYPSSAPSSLTVSSFVFPITAGSTKQPQHRGLACQVLEQSFLGGALGGM
jgi:hypothetical protein